MRRSLILLFVLAAASGCLGPVQDFSLGTLDGGADSGAGGGSGGAGGGSAGGAGGGGGGGAQDAGPTDAGTVIVITDAGLVPANPNLPLGNCGTVLTLPGDCSLDGGPCLSFHRQGQAPQTVASGDDFGDWHFAVGASASGFAFVGVDAGTSTLWLAREGQPLHTIETAPAGQAIRQVSGFAEGPPYAFWYVSERFFTNNALASRQLMLLSDVSGQATYAAAIPTPPTSRAATQGTDYFVGLADGLHSYYPAGGGLLVPLASVGGGAETIIDVAADDAGQVFFLQCPQTGACSLWRHRRQPSATTLMLAQLPPLRGGVVRGASIAVHGDSVYILGVQYLLRVPKAGGAGEVVYRGESFPQFGGTLKAESLTLRGGKLYFGRICHFDADAPGYGTIELDPTALTARWLDLDPNYPFVPFITGYEAWGTERMWAGAGGVFVRR